MSNAPWNYGQLAFYAYILLAHHAILWPAIQAAIKCRSLYFVSILSAGNDMEGAYWIMAFLLASEHAPFARKQAPFERESKQKPERSLFPGYFLPPPPPFRHQSMPPGLDPPSQIACGLSTSGATARNRRRTFWQDDPRKRRNVVSLACVTRVSLLNTSARKSKHTTKRAFSKTYKFDLYINLQ